MAIFLEIAISGNRNLVGLVIASETAWESTAGTLYVAQVSPSAAFYVARHSSVFYDGAVQELDVGDHLGRLTRDYQGVSLAITRPTKLRFPEIAISGFPDFFRQKSGKIRKIVFLDSRDQNKLLNFLCFFI